MKDEFAPLARIDSFPFQHRIREVMSAPIITAGEMTPLVEAVDTMYARRVSSIVAVDEAGRTAVIFTERDLLRILSTQGPDGLAATLGTSGSRPVVTVNANSFVFVALAKMARLGVRHLVVVDDDNRPVGMVTGRSLLQVRATDALKLGEMVEQARTPEDMGQAVKALPDLARRLLAEGVAARNIAAVIGQVVRDLTAQAAQLAEAAMAEDGWGPPPVTYALLVLGSGGRGESLLAFDQDNAIVHAGSEAEDVWFAELGRRVNGMLDGAGIPFCPGKVMAGERPWRRGLEEWEEEIHNWVFSVKTESVLYCDIFFDFQPVWGDRALAESLRDYAIAQAGQSAFFLRYLAQNVAEMDSPVNPLGMFSTQAGRINLKKSALLPLVSAARLRAIRAGITNTATDERFAALKDKGLLHQDDLKDFLEIHEIVFRCILDQQIADLASGVKASAAIDPKHFDHRVRDRLRWVFRRLRDLKQVCGLGR